MKKDKELLFMLVGFTFFYLWVVPSCWIKSLFNKDKDLRDWWTYGKGKKYHDK